MNLIFMDERKSVIWKVNDFEIEITHPQKIYFPQNKITKLEVASYYKTISNTVLPYFKDRPVTLHYFPRGIAGDVSFYKRNIKQTLPQFISLATYKEKTQPKTIHVPIINNEASLLYFVSRGVLEFHLWNATYPNFDYPDYAVIDLDTNSEKNFNQMRQASLLIKEYLEGLQLVSYIKTTGGTGLHIFIPILPKYTSLQVRDFIKTLGKEISSKHPKILTVSRVKGKTHVKHMISLDYSQNAISRSMVAPYSLRSDPRATVSTPLTWEEIAQGNFTPSDFTLQHVLKRLKDKKDPFKGVLNHKQKLPI